MFSPLCTVKANMSPMVKALKPQRGAGGVVYYQQNYDIVLLFGLTELRAQMSWMENVRCISTFHLLIS